MRQKIALSWLIPAAMILLLHTLIPHSHDFLAHHEAQTCTHHEHSFWEFVEHLLHQDCGENHLEYYQITFEEDIDFDNLFISHDLPHFLIFDKKIITQQYISLTDFSFKNPFLLLSLTLRGPPYSNV